LEKFGAAATPMLLQAYDRATGEHLRWEIVNLLGYTRDPRAIPLLADRGVQDNELHPRWRSIWALTSVDDGSAAARLRRHLIQNTGLRRRNAAVALSLFRDPAAVPVLRKGLRAKNTWLRWESASCLVGYADRRAARVILDLYARETDPSIRHEMVRAVAGVQTPAVISFLKRRLAEPAATIRSVAVDALVRSANGQARRLLAARLKKERDRSVKQGIRQALTGLNTSASA
jgi:HEAT repeat protein